MAIPLFAAFGQTILMLLLGFVAVFLILLILVQRGRGGGLAGALGGMGGSSAFGAKAGDVFTKITCVAAFVWIVLCIAASKMAPTEESLLDTGVTSSSTSLLDTPSLEPATGSEESSEGSATAEAAAPAESDSTADAPTEEAPAEEESE